MQLIFYFYINDFFSNSIDVLYIVICVHAHTAYITYSVRNLQREVNIPIPHIICTHTLTGPYSGYLKKIAITPLVTPDPSFTAVRGTSAFCIENHNNNSVFHPNLGGVRSETKRGRNFNLLTSARTPGDRFARLRRGNYAHTARPGLPLLFFRLFSSGIYLFIFIFVVVSDPRRNAITRTYTHTHIYARGLRLITVPQRLKRSPPPAPTPLSVRRRRQIHALWDPQRSRVRKQSVRIYTRGGGAHKYVELGIMGARSIRPSL